MPFELSDVKTHYVIHYSSPTKIWSFILFYLQLSSILSLCLTHAHTIRNTDEMANSKCKRLRPGKVSPRRPVPAHILRPPYVNSRTPPGIASGPEVHDDKGIECMRASGRLAAQVLQYAGSLVKVTPSSTYLLFIFISLM